MRPEAAVPASIPLQASGGEPTVLLCPGPRGFLGHKTFYAKTRRVP